MANAMRRAGFEMRDSLSKLLDELRGYAESRDDDLIVHVMSRWISLKSRKHGRIFAELRPSKEGIEVFVLPPPRDLGFSSIVTMAPSSQGWGWFKSKFMIHGNGGVATALRLLRISYISSSRRGRSLSRRR